MLLDDSLGKSVAAIVLGVDQEPELKRKQRLKREKEFLFGSVIGGAFLSNLACKNKTFKIETRAGDRDMAQRLRVLTALPETLSSVPSNLMMVAGNHL